MKTKKTETTPYVVPAKDVIQQLPPAVQLLLSEWVAQLYENIDTLQATFADEPSLIQSYLVYNLRGSRKQKLSLDDDLIAFFSKVTFSTLLDEMATFYTHCTYTVDDKTIHFGVDKIAISKLGVTIEGTQKKVSLSHQAFFLLRALELEFSQKATIHALVPYAQQKVDDNPLDAHRKILEHDDMRSYYMQYEPTTAILIYMLFSRKLFNVCANHYKFEPEFTMLTDFHLLKTKVVVDALYRKYSIAKQTTAEQQIKGLKTKLDEATTKLDKQKELTKKKQEQLDTFKKEQPTKATPLKADPKMKEFEQQITALKADLTTKNREYDLHMRMKQSDIDRKQQELDEVKRERSTLQQQVHELKAIQQQMTQQPTVSTIDEWLSIGQELLQQTTEQQHDAITAFFASYVTLAEQRFAKQQPKSSTTDVFGYYEAKFGGHYIHFLNGQVERIKNLPNNVYLRDQQFVRVTENFEYVERYYHYFYDGPVVNPQAFSIVTYHDDKPYVYDAGQMMPLKLKSDEQAREGQIVAFSKTYDMLRYYLEANVNTLDHYAASINAKGHAFYYVQQLIGTGAVVIEPFTNKVTYMELPQDHNVQQYEGFTYSDGEVVHIFGKHGFYERSDFYTKREFATIEELAEQCFIRKTNRELVILQYDPKKFTPVVGEVVAIDEHHRYLYRETTESTVAETIEQRKLAYIDPAQPKKEQPVYSAVPNNNKPSITVVTNTTYANNYKVHLEPYFNVQLVDAFEGEAKVMQAARKAELIVLCTQHLNHPISKKIQKEFPGRYFLDHSEGGNLLALNLQNHFRLA